MLAVDTNILIRYLTRDDPTQSSEAVRLIKEGRLFVSITVMLETEWVLRRSYGFQTTALAKALRSFAGLPNITFDAPERLAQALDWMDDGLDFADALHLAGAKECERFVTFDKALVRAASRLDAIPVVAPK
jgi:predicted nucleic-acid-binding protein